VKKKWVLLLIIAFPSLFWLILETSTINSKKLPYYGPKKAVSAGDTVYHSVNDHFYIAGPNGDTSLKKIDETLYAIAFLSEQYRADAYRLTGLWEYLTYKKGKIEHIPVILALSGKGKKEPKVYRELKKLDEHNNIHFTSLAPDDFKLRVKEYFAGKPYYIDYSFFLLVDGERHIRGYYDGRYVSEFKRLAEEYQHLRLKEEKQKLIKSNEIKTD
jgi:hypothetical protein